MKRFIRLPFALALWHSEEFPHFRFRHWLFCVALFTLKNSLRRPWPTARAVAPVATARFPVLRRLVGANYESCQSTLICRSSFGATIGQHVRHDFP